MQATATIPILTWSRSTCPLPTLVVASPLRGVNYCSRTPVHEPQADALPRLPAAPSRSHSKCHLRPSLRAQPLSDCSPARPDIHRSSGIYVLSLLRPILLRVDTHIVGIAKGLPKKLIQVSDESSSVRYRWRHPSYSYIRHMFGESTRALH